MKAKELSALAKVMRANGITYLKTSDVTLKMGGVSPVMVSLPKVNPVEKPVEITPEEEAEIKHRVEEMTSLMKLGDLELAERLFPDTSDRSHEESA